VATVSERDAWEAAKRLAADLRTGRLGSGQVASRLDNLARKMIAQLGSGIHTNPPLIIYGNPPKDGELMSRRVYAVEYRHAGDGEDYRHDCAAGVSMYALGNAIVLQRPDRKPLSREFDG
jgi:hypothetical protein